MAITVTMVRGASRLRRQTGFGYRRLWVRLTDGPKRIDLGQLDRAVTVEMAPEPGPERVEFSVVDDLPRPGINPYWVRVTQSDMEKGLDESGFRGLCGASVGVLAKMRIL